MLRLTLCVGERVLVGVPSDPLGYIEVCEKKSGAGCALGFVLPGVPVNRERIAWSILVETARDGRMPALTRECLSKYMRTELGVAHV
jgi:hypothetical protein